MKMSSFHEEKPVIWHLVPLHRNQRRRPWTSWITPWMHYQRNPEVNSCWILQVGFDAIHGHKRHWNRPEKKHEGSPSFRTRGGTWHVNDVESTFRHIAGCAFQRPGNKTELRICSQYDPVANIRTKSAMLQLGPYQDLLSYIRARKREGITIWPRQSEKCHDSNTSCLAI